ncbi:MAG: SDR family oxidoreductase [Gemmatimonadetes bacterium]|nr:SDR family oxidoreductase [Gemmatimonadota bacterium]
MKVAIFGASGQTGLFLVERALLQNHEVAAFVRTPETFPLRHEQLRVLTGDVRSREAVAQAIEGADAVICAVGELLKSSRVGSQATENIIAAMKQHGVKRLVTVTGPGAGDRKKRMGGLARLVLKLFVNLDDKERQEELIRASGLDWIIVRPSLLTNDPHTGAYRVGPDVTHGIATKLARSDLAEFMLNQLTDDTYVHQMPAIHH